MTPAEVAENLLPKSMDDDVDKRMKNLVAALENKVKAVEQARAKMEAKAMAKVEEEARAKAAKEARARAMAGAAADAEEVVEESIGNGS